MAYILLIASGLLLASCGSRALVIPCNIGEGDTLCVVGMAEGDLLVGAVSPVVVGRSVGSGPYGLGGAFK